MESSSIIIGIGGSKGGIGKTTLCTLLATHLWHELPDLRTAIWDMDDQGSAVSLRREDIFMMEQDEDFKNQGPVKYRNFQKGKKIFREALQSAPLYPIRSYISEGSYARLSEDMKKDRESLRLQELEKLDNRTKDLIFVDLPGTIDYDADMQSLVQRMNCMLVPVDCTSGKEIRAIRDYFEVLDILINQGDNSIKGNIYCVWNMIDSSIYKKNPGESPSERKERVSNKIQEIKSACNFIFPFLDTVLPDTKQIADDTFASLIPLGGKSDSKSAIGALTNEIFSKCINL